MITTGTLYEFCLQTTNGVIPPDSFPTERLCQATEIAIDLETKDPNLKELGPGYIKGDGEVVGISFATVTDTKIYPFAHEQGFNFSKKKVLEFTKRFALQTVTRYFTTQPTMLGGLLKRRDHKRSYYRHNDSCSFD